MRGRRNRWLFPLVLLAGVAAFTGLWYAASGDSAGSEPAFGGVYVEGVIGAPSRVNPVFAAQNDVDEALAALVFAGLTRLDDQGAPFPDLAESWTLSADARTYTFRLRQGLVWQDGSPLTADDVLFTYELLRSPTLRMAPPLSRLLADVTLEKVDARTVTLTLPKPFAPLPAYLTLGILPAHLVETTGAAALFDAPFNQQPVGAGPYRLEELSRERAVLVANASYHLGRPFVQRIELRFYRDEGALLAALKARQVGGALFAGRLGSADLLYIERRSDVAATTLTTTETAYVFFNLRRSLFQDRRLREALLHGLDRDAIVAEVLQGQALRADSPLVPASWAYADALGRYKFDANLAGLLLDEAGWRRNASGARTKDGRELAFTLTTSADPVWLAVAGRVAEQWKALGIRVTVDNVGSTGLVRDVLEPRSFEAALFAGIGDADPDPYPAWHSSQTGSKGGNLSQLSDDRVDRVLDEGRVVANQPRRRELYVEFQELFAQEVPSIPLYVSTALYVQPRSLRGVRAGLLDSPGARFKQVQEWHLRTR